MSQTPPMYSALKVMVGACMSWPEPARMLPVSPESCKFRNC